MSKPAWASELEAFSKAIDPEIKKVEQRAHEDSERSSEELAGIAGAVVFGIAGAALCLLVPGGEAIAPLAALLGARLGSAIAILIARRFSRSWKHKQWLLAYRRKVEALDQDIDVLEKRLERYKETGEEDLAEDCRTRIIAFQARRGELAADIAEVPDLTETRDEVREGDTEKWRDRLRALSDRAGLLDVDVKKMDVSTGNAALGKQLYDCARESLSLAKEAEKVSRRLRGLRDEAQGVLAIEYGELGSEVAKLIVRPAGLIEGALDNATANLPADQLGDHEKKIRKIVFELRGIAEKSMRLFEPPVPPAPGQTAAQRAAARRVAAGGG
jgi:hypothetical protein